MPQKAGFVRKNNNQGKTVLVTSNVFYKNLCFTVSMIIQMQCDIVLAE